MNNIRIIIRIFIIKINITKANIIKIYINKTHIVNKTHDITIIYNSKDYFIIREYNFVGFFKQFICKKPIRNKFYCWQTSIMNYIYLFIYLFIHLFIYLSIYLSIYLFIYLFIYSFIHLFFYLFICNLLKVDHGTL